MTNKNLVEGYASAYFAVANAEGELAKVRSELRAIEGAVVENENLRAALSDRMLSPATRNKIVDDLLANKTSDSTRALVGMTVSAGHGAQLSEIIKAFMGQAASSQGRKLATVRSAVALSEDQKVKLSEALKASEGVEIEIENIVDTEIVGGIVTVIGDKVIDGSLRSKLDQMRESL